jgi:hypothetical protein
MRQAVRDEMGALFDSLAQGMIGKVAPAVAEKVIANLASQFGPQLMQFVGRLEAAAANQGKEPVMVEGVNWAARGPNDPPRVQVHTTMAQEIRNLHDAVVEQTAATGELTAAILEDVDEEEEEEDEPVRKSRRSKR